MKPRSPFSSVRFNVFLRSLAYLLGQVSSTFLIGPLMLLCWPLPFAARYRVAGYWVRFNLWWLRVTCCISYEVSGLEHIPKGSSGLIFCKHQSVFETLVLQVIFPPVVFILKQELLRLPVWGWAMATLKPIAINRSLKSKALKQILTEGAERIRSGLWVVLFPEGTRVAPGRRGHYGSSGGMLASRAGCALVPVAHNAGSFWPRNGFLKSPGLIRILIGPPLDGRSMSAAELNSAAEQWIEAAMPSLEDHLGQPSIRSDPLAPSRS